MSWNPTMHTGFWKTLLATVILLAGLNTAQAADPIKIGAFLTVTGPASFLGDPELKTLQMLIADLNAKGGVNGRPLELIHYDTGGNAREAVNFVKRLIKKDNVDLLIGGTTSGDTLAVIPEVEKEGIPFISLAAAVEITEPTKKMGVQGRADRPHGGGPDFCGYASAGPD
jgi:branched-chain amino acid transport system substrate-binding protein